MQIYSSQHILYIKTPPGMNHNGTVAMYDLVGQEVFSAALNDNLLNKFQPTLNDGYYIVKVVTGSEVHTQKVFFSN